MIHYDQMVPGRGVSLRVSIVTTANTPGADGPARAGETSGFDACRRCPL